MILVILALGSACFIFCVLPRFGMDVCAEEQVIAPIDDTASSSQSGAGQGSGQGVDGAQDEETEGAEPKAAHTNRAAGNADDAGAAGAAVADDFGEAEMQTAVDTMGLTGENTDGVGDSSKITGEFTKVPFTP